MVITTRRMARQAEEAAEEAHAPVKVPRTPRKSAEAVVAPREMPQPPPSPLPTFWYAFFGIVEPISTFSGAALALVTPANFYQDLVPQTFFLPGFIRDVPPVPPPSAAGMAIAQLGSCYVLLTLNGAVFFYTVKKYVQDPFLLQTLVQAVLIVLGIADWIHIIVTLLYLPTPLGAEAGLLPKLKFLLKPTSWNALLFGNVIITLILFFFRAAWLAGVGRARIPVRTEETKTDVLVTPKRGRPRKTPAKTPKSE